MNTTYYLYLHRVLSQLGTDIASYFQGKSPVLFRLENYHAVFLELSGGFGFGGWLFYVLMILFAFGVVGCLLTFFVLSLRRFSLKTFAKKSEIVEKEQELETLRLAYANGVSNGAPSTVAAPVQYGDGETRFPRLCQIDAQYEEPVIPDPVQISLKEMAAKFRNFAASRLNLYYDETTIAAFLSSLACTRLLILEGASGTGKTSLPYAFGAFTGTPVHICPVQPSWRERSDLVGYYNEFTGKFSESDFLVALYQAHYSTGPVLVVLDEMNLARVEYYFAEFLSLLENPMEEAKEFTVVGQSKAQDPKLLNNGKLRIPDNVFFIGTLNNDESTLSLTDKVYDRAMNLALDQRATSFDAPEVEPIFLSFHDFQRSIDEACAQEPLPQDVWTGMSDLLRFCADRMNLYFGNRLKKQFEVFYPAFVACGQSAGEAIDVFVSAKILRKVFLSPYREDAETLEELQQFLVRCFPNIVLERTLTKIHKKMEARQ